MAQIVTEVVKRVWAEKGQTATETRAKFLCPWGSACKNAPGSGAARPCNNVHDSTAPIMTIDVINNARSKADVKTYKDLVAELLKAFENA